MKSIRSILVQRITLILALTFTGLILLIAMLNLFDSREWQQRTADTISSTLISQGLTLVSNNGHALEEMVADNAFGAVRRLVSVTVGNDLDIRYGIYMDSGRQPWVMATEANPKGRVEKAMRLDDPMAQWAGELTAADYRLVTGSNEKIYEFAAPVILDETRQGVIRYGFSTRRIQTALSEAEARARYSVIRTILALLGIGSLALFAGLAATRFITTWITAPLAQLTAATHAISQGDYEQAVAIDSDNEVGVLSRNFESMRGNILNHRRELEKKNASLLEAQAELEDLNQNLEQKVRLRTEELHRVQAQLIDAARDAGKAEIAINVLHNIGNVINSVNVSNQKNNELLRNSGMENLLQAVALLRQNRESLAEYLTNDDKGRLVPELLDRLTQALGGEHDNLLSNTQRLEHNISLVKSIISTQQAYAKLGGMVENFDIGHVVRESVNLQEALLQKNHVRVELSVNEDLLVEGDRTKVHHVVNNLLINAREALFSTNPAERLIRISAAMVDDQIVLEVEDNGEGIAPEHLESIFRHGFTNKADGHGFGLHSCANDIGEMGGTIEAFSKGPGTGARFRIILPKASG
jgi:signal transduction histidine kinase